MQDKRGSIAQRFLYDLVLNIYPNYTVIYEQPIPAIKQRYDIFIKELGVAIEYDGIQHNKFVEHFHRDMNGFLLQGLLDEKKNNFSEENGIKLVRVDGDVLHHTKESFEKIIDSCEYPDTEYSYTILKQDVSVKNSFQKDNERRKQKELQKSREYRKKSYALIKDDIKKKNKEYRKRIKEERSRT